MRETPTNTSFLASSPSGDDNHLEKEVEVQGVDTEGWTLPSTNLKSETTIKVEGVPQRFSYDELSVATEAFCKESKLGHGGFGTVYRGVLPSGSLVAVKRMNSLKQSQGTKEFKHEISMLAQLSHRNLVELHGWCADRAKNEYMVVYELMPNGSLDNLLFSPNEGKTRLSWPQRFKILIGTASALEYLHQGFKKQVVHRDIKCSNIMLDEDLTAKLGDFGIARLIDHERGAATTNMAGTLGYIAPEVYSDFTFTDKADVYAFGVVILETACGRKVLPSYPHEKPLVPWVLDSHRKGAMLSMVDKQLSDYDKQQMEVVLQVGLLCTSENPDSRPSMRRVAQLLAREVEVPAIPVVNSASTMAKTKSLAQRFATLLQSRPSGRPPINHLHKAELADMHQSIRSSNSTRAFRYLEESSRPKLPTNDTKPLQDVVSALKNLFIQRRRNSNNKQKPSLPINPRKERAKRRKEKAKRKGKMQAVESKLPSRDTLPWPKLHTNYTIPLQNVVSALKNLFIQRRRNSNNKQQKPSLPIKPKKERAKGQKERAKRKGKTQAVVSELPQLDTLPWGDVLQTDDEEPESPTGDIIPWQDEVSELPVVCRDSCCRDALQNPYSSSNGTYSSVSQGDANVSIYNSNLSSSNGSSSNGTYSSVSQGDANVSIYNSNVSSSNGSSSNGMYTYVNQQGANVSIYNSNVSSSNGSSSNGTYTYVNQQGANASIYNSNVSSSNGSSSNGMYTYVNQQGANASIYNSNVSSSNGSSSNGMYTYVNQGGRNVSIYNSNVSSSNGPSSNGMYTYVNQGGRNVSIYNSNVCTSSSGTYDQGVGNLYMEQQYPPSGYYYYYYYYYY